MWGGGGRATGSVVRRVKGGNMDSKLWLTFATCVDIQDLG